jgi:hypothetical protein
MNSEKKERDVYREERVLKNLKFKIKCFAPKIWIVIGHFCPCPLVLDKVK